MKKLYENKSVGILSSVAFVVLFAVNFYFCWTDFICSGFVFNGFISIFTITMPVHVTVLSSVFVASLLAMGISGIVYRNKALVIIPSVYFFLLIIGFIMLSVTVKNSSDCAFITDFAMWSAVVILSPLFGFIITLGKLSVLLLIILFIFTIVSVITVFHKAKTNK